jgi:hypothetical protein
MKKFWNLGKKKSTPQEFWDWFVLNNVRLKTMDLNALINEIFVKGSEVDPGLRFGLMPGKDGADWVLEVCAGGVRATIPAVETLVAAAPVVPGWEIVAFRQPRDLPEIRMGDHSVDLNLTRFVETGRKGAVLDVTLYLPVPAGVPKHVTGELGFIALDHTLGEMVVMSRLGQVRFENILAAPPNAQLLCVLPEIVK